VRRRGLAAAVLLAVACAPSEPAPRQAAGEFWEALRAGDREAARARSTSATAHRVDRLQAGRRIDEVLLGETLAGERSAIVRTSLATSLDGSPLHTTFDTHLVRTADGWRVDVAATERDLTAAIVAGSIALFGDAVGRGVEEFGEVLQQGAAEISRAIREALEELEREPQ
jgi:hypothetical protein